MINIRKMSHALVVAAAVLVLCSCSNNTTIKHSYVNPKLGGMDLQGVLIVAVTQENKNRVSFENAFAEALSRQGVTVQASHTLLPQDKPTADEVIAAAAEANLDTVLVTRYVGEMAQEVYHPGTLYYGVTPMYNPVAYGGYGGYYNHAYEVAYQQPVWTSNVVHTVISDLYVAKTKEHLWQAVSDTVKGGDTEQLRNDAIKGLIRNLKEQGLL